MRRTSHFRLPPILCLLVLLVLICPLVAPPDAAATPVVLSPTSTRTRTPTPTVGAETAGALLSWSLHTLDDAKAFSQFGSHHFRLKLGLPRLAYGGDHLYYAWYGTGGWHYEVVDGARGVGAHASLAFDSTGMPNISYRDALNGSLKYARKVNQVWQVQTVVTGGVTGHTSLEMDAGDHPHMTFITANGLSYATFGPLGWEVEQVARNADLGAPITGEALALDRQGQPQVAYNVSQEQGIYYASRDAAGWHIEGVPLGDFGSSNGGDIALALYPNGDPYLIASFGSRDTWYHNLVPGVMSAKRIGGEWLFQAEGLAVPDATVAIAITSNGTAYLARSRPGTTSLRTDPGAGAWSDVDTWAGGVAGLALALDDQGQPHLSEIRELDDLPDVVNHLRQQSGQWVEEVVDRSSDVGRANSVAVDAAGNPGVGYHDAKNNAVKLARWSGAAWTTETVESSIPQSGGVSLQFTTGSAPRIAYMAGSAAGPNLLRYGEESGAGWARTTLETVGAETAAGTNPVALHLTSSNAARIAYKSTSDQYPALVRLASNVLGAWEFQTAYFGYQVGPSVGLDVDKADKSHLVYPTADVLIYAYQVPEGWGNQYAVVDELTGTSALALDANDIPHTCYSVNRGDTTELGYAHIGWVWESGTIEGTNGGGDWCAIAVDRAGNVHISYDGGAAGLMYARKSGSGWTFSTVDARGGERTSIALDKNDVPYISYYDAVDHALRVAGGKWIIPGNTPTPTATTTSLCRATPTPHPPYAGTPPASGILQRQVAHCMDDAYQVTGSTVELRSDTTSLKMGGRPGTSVPYVSYLGGLLFRDVRVPGGSVITAARLTLWPWGEQTGAPVVLEVAGERAVQPEPFWEGNPWPYVRAKTAARATWTMPSILGTTTYAESPDLAAVVQELVNQPGWQAGRDISILLGPAGTENTISWAAYDAWAAHAPELVIQYAPRPADTATPTPTATAAATATATTAATATETATPSATPTATATETVLPTITPTPAANLRTYLPLILATS